MSYESLKVPLGSGVWVQQLDSKLHTVALLAWYHQKWTKQLNFLLCLTDLSTGTLSHSPSEVLNSDAWWGLAFYYSNEVSGRGRPLIYVGLQWNNCKVTKETWTSWLWSSWNFLKVWGWSNWYSFRFQPPRLELQMGDLFGSTLERFGPTLVSFQSHWLGFQPLLLARIARFHFKNLED